VLKKLTLTIMNIEQAKKIPLQKVLQAMGYSIQKVNDNGIDLWFRSPFRTEIDASFHINTKKNIWFDFGEGQGGTIMDFAIKITGGTAKDALQFLKKYDANPNQDIRFFHPTNENNPTKKEKKEAFTLLSVSEIKSKNLKILLEQRGIDFNIAQKYLKEIHFANAEEKNFYAIGIENRVGGYEIRNKYFKGSIGKKDICYLDNENNDKVFVFEGFIDYLSCLCDRKVEQLKGEIIILNSVAFQTQAIELINNKNHQLIFTAFDNDNAGQQSTKNFIKNFGKDKVLPMNTIYEPHKDYNEFWMEQLKAVFKG